MIRVTLALAGAASILSLREKKYHHKDTKNTKEKLRSFFAFFAALRETK